ncbi:MAG: nucleotidyltransferase family protein, partial [Clostridia bacterium]|nr:nucleotidyltransferase family protein [Clostridia bacterium]
MYELNLTKEQKILLNLAAMGLSDTPQELLLEKEELDGADWNAIMQESLAQTVPMTVFQAAKAYESEIPQDVFARWKNLFFQAYQTNVRVQQAQADMAELMREEGFGYIVIKGESSAAYYPNPELRALGDVDFLIDTSRQAEIESALMQAGYERDGMEHISHRIFRKVGAHLEMHYQVPGIPVGEKGDKVRAFLKDAVKCGECRQGGLAEFYAPCPKHHGLIILLHMQHHNLDDGLGLRHLCDWAAFVNATQNEAFWTDELLPLMKEIGIMKYASVATKLCATYLHIPCPTWAADADDALCDGLLADVFLGGNFGRKNNERARSGSLIAKKGEKKRGPIATMAVSLHRAVLLKYPIVKKVWIL